MGGWGVSLPKIRDAGPFDLWCGSASENNDSAFGSGLKSRKTKKKKKSKRIFEGFKNSIYEKMDIKTLMGFQIIKFKH